MKNCRWFIEKQKNIKYKDLCYHREMRKRLGNGMTIAAEVNKEICKDCIYYEKN